MTDLPAAWMDLNRSERDVLLAVAINEPVEFAPLWAAVGGADARAEKYLQSTIDDLRGRGLIARERLPADRRKRRYRLTDAGRDRVDRLQELLWAVATA